MGTILNILLITDPVDAHAEAVMDHLEQRGVRIVRFHPAELLRGFRATCINLGAKREEGNFTTPGGHVIRFEDIHAVYYRNTDKVRVPKQISDSGVTAFAAEESHQNFQELLEVFQGYWLTHPWIIRRAQSKVLQTHVASQIGLQIPRSCWSNDPDEIIDFANSIDGELVVKPISDVEFYKNQLPHTVWTSAITQRFLIEHKEDLASMFSHYQERVPRAADVRVTVVGERVFACEMLIPKEYQHIADWREVPVDPDHRPVKLPPEIEQKLLKFNRALGVEYGAIDLIRTPKNEYFFLESNINGQWLWTQDLAGLPIAESIAELLIERGGCFADER